MLASLFNKSNRTQVERKKQWCCNGIPRFWDSHAIVFAKVILSFVNVNGLSRFYSKLNIECWSTTYFLQTKCYLLKVMDVPPLLTYHMSNESLVKLVISNLQLSVF